MFRQIFNSFNLFKFSNFKKNKAISSQTKKSLSNSVGFTLVELLVVISIIGFLTVSSVVVFSIVRMNARDAIRIANIATISRALALYLNDSATGYPQSDGECLDATTLGGVGKEFLDTNVILVVPTDPFWPSAAPAHTAGVVTPGQTNFCYFYYSNSYNQYRLSFYLESNSKAGNAGINTNVMVP